MRIVLANDFHNTKSYLHLPISGTRAHTISEGQRRRIKTELCGISGCMCSENDLGERPARHLILPLRGSMPTHVGERWQVLHEHEYDPTSAHCSYIPEERP